MRTGSAGATPLPQVLGTSRSLPEIENHGVRTSRLRQQTRATRSKAVLAAILQSTADVHLHNLLDRCRTLEERAATAYRRFAARARGEPSLCAMWTELARDEEDHARSVEAARGDIEAAEGRCIEIEGWTEAIDDIDRRLTNAERLGPEATTDDQLVAALDLEMSELEGLRRLLLLVTRHRFLLEPQEAHVTRLGDAATRYSTDPRVRLLAATLLVRARLKDTGTLIACSTASAKSPRGNLP